MLEALNVMLGLLPLRLTSLLPLMYRVPRVVPDCGATLLSVTLFEFSMMMFVLFDMVSPDMLVEDVAPSS